VRTHLVRVLDYRRPKRTFFPEWERLCSGATLSQLERRLLAVIDSTLNRNSASLYHALRAVSNYVAALSCSTANESLKVRRKEFQEIFSLDGPVEHSEY